MLSSLTYKLEKLALDSSKPGYDHSLLLPKGASGDDPDQAYGLCDAASDL